NSGNYSVLLKNPAGTILSSNALLTVLPPPACAPLPNGLISWWRAENDLLDGWGANAGSGQLLLGRLPPNVAFVQGKVGNAFSLLTNYVLVSDVPSLRPTNGLTIEGWIFPRTFLTSNPRTILSKFDPPNFATRTNS